MDAQINRLTCENTTRPQVDIDHLINNDIVNTYNFDFSQMDIEPNELGDQFTVLNLNDIQQQFFEQDDEDRDYREYREDRYEEYREDDYYRNQDQEEDREDYYGNQEEDREEPEDQEDQEGEQEAQHYSNSGWYNVQTRMFHIGEMDGTQFVPYMEDVRNIEYFGQHVDGMDVEAEIVEAVLIEAEVVEDLDDEEIDDEEIDDDSEEDEDMYDIMVRLEDENQDLRQQLEIARNQSRIVFPDGHRIGFETQNDVRYLYVYHHDNNDNDRGPLTLDELQCDDEHSETDDNNGMDLS